MLIRTAIFFYKMGTMTSNAIRQGVVSYNIAENKYHRVGIPLKLSRILNAMKMANKVMSDKLLEVWIDKYKKYLYYNDSKQYGIKAEPIIYPHEFMILLSQAKNLFPLLTDTLDHIVDEKLSFKVTKRGLSIPSINGSSKYIRDEIRESLNNEVGDFKKASTLNANFYRL